MNYTLEDFRVDATLRTCNELFNIGGDSTMTYPLMQVYGLFFATVMSPISFSKELKEAFAQGGIDNMKARLNTLFETSRGVLNSVASSAENSNAVLTDSLLEIINTVDINNMICTYLIGNIFGHEKSVIEPADIIVLQSWYDETDRLCEVDIDSWDFVTCQSINLAINRSQMWRLAQMIPHFKKLNTREQLKDSLAVMFNNSITEDTELIDLIRWAFFGKDDSYPF